MIYQLMLVYGHGCLPYSCKFRDRLLCGNLRKSHKLFIFALLSGAKDWQKYETARRLHKQVDKIRAQYHEDFKSKEMRVRQRAVALYFIDKVNHCPVLALCKRE